MLKEDSSPWWGRAMLDDSGGSKSSLNKQHATGKLHAVPEASRVAKAPRTWQKAKGNGEDEKRVISSLFHEHRPHPVKVSWSIVRRCSPAFNQRESHTGS